jgi:hypothetical protein
MTGFDGQSERQKLLREVACRSLPKRYKNFLGNLERDTIDLTALPALHIIDLLWDMIGTDYFLLHGSNGVRIAGPLRPEKANDAAKPSGNANAVYATTIVDVALLHGIFNREYVRSQIQSFTLGYRVQLTGLELFASDSLLAYFLTGDPRLFSSGHIYLLDRMGFSRSEDGFEEYQCSTPYSPLAIFKVSANLRDFLFSGAGHWLMRPFACMGNSVEGHFASGS